MEIEENNLTVMQGKLQSTNTICKHEYGLPTMFIIVEQVKSQLGVKKCNN